MVPEIQEGEVKHTPLPWFKSMRPEVDVDEVIQTGKHSVSMTGGYTGNDEYDRDGGIYAVIDGEPETIVQPWKEADADFIFTACNSHYKLLEALEEVEKASAATGYYIGQNGQLIKKVRAAIAAARGQE